jgi:nicotinamidase-related amidase
MRSALLVLGAQRHLLEGDAAVPSAVAVRGALEGLLARAREAGARVVHVQNDGPAGYPDEPGTPGWELAVAPAAGETVLHKDVSDALAANPHLADELRAAGVAGVVVAGMQSDFCVRATCRAALQAGFHVTLASGAHATRDDDAPAADLARLVEEELAADGVAVVAAADVRF